MKFNNFSAFKNLFYIFYICISAFFLMNDYKMTTLIMMVVLAPAIIIVEHYESTKANNRAS